MQPKPLDGGCAAVEIKRKVFMVSCISLQDRLLKTVAEGKGTKSLIKISEPKLWWPHLMHEDPGYLYTMKISLSKGSVIDVYRVVQLNYTPEILYVA